MKYWALAFMLPAALAQAINVNPQCGTITTGALRPAVTIPRITAISPFVVFFDPSGTTDTQALGGAGTTFQDITYSWAFGDTLKSGTSTWSYGSNANHNVRNLATGSEAAHLFRTEGRDTKYTITLTARDGVNTVKCGVGVTVYDPSGSNGFPGFATTCVSASGTPTAGSGGCPAGATVLNSSSLSASLTSPYFGSNKRTLYKCGDTFTGNGIVLDGVKWRVDAYGGCEGTKTNRPIWSGTTGDVVDIAGTAGDGVIASIDINGNGTANAAVGSPAGDFLKISYQITLYNVNARGTSGAYSFAQGAQWAIVDSAMQNMIAHLGVFGNYSENNQPYSGNTINNLDYMAMLGNLYNGTGNTVTGGGQEVLRISAGRMITIADNTIENANAIGGVIKLHAGNSYHSFPTWGGAYLEKVEVSDNWFGGTSGGIPIDIDPQNNNDDERLRFIIFERNMVTNAGCCEGGFQMSLAASNSTVRENAFIINSTASPLVYAQQSFRFGQLGVEPVASGDEVYNNSFYAPTSRDNAQICIGMNALAMHASPINSFVQNNECYFTSGTHSPVLTGGSGNTISNNTTNAANNPGFINGSSSFSLISDFKPTANYAGGTTVPVQLDALSVTWPPTWDLGAIHH